MATVFVGGFLRTGTTLMQNLLCAAPGTHSMLGEVTYLLGLVESYGRSVHMWDVSARHYFSSPEALRDFSRHQVLEFLDHTRVHLGGPEHLVLKYPQLTGLFPLLSTLLPEARFVVMVRDPRDAVASARRAGARGAPEFQSSTPQSIAHEFMTTYRSALGGARPQYNAARVVVRFEDLVRDPEAVLGAIGARTGLDLSHPSLVGDLQLSTQAGSSPLRSALVGQLPNATRIGQYGSVLTPREVSEVCRICQPLMAQLHYR